MKLKSILYNIKTLAGIRDASVSKVSGAAMDHIESIDNAWIIIIDDRIDSFGKMEDLKPEIYEDFDIQMDVEGQCVMPAFNDSHTHIVYAASRESEFVDRIKGLSYEEIAKRGGGILNSAKRLQEMSEDELFDVSLERLLAVQATGTANIEIKSGYGLTTEAELKMLRVIRRLKGKTKQTIKATFLAAHAYPTEYKQNHQGYIDLIINEMLPKVADEGLADYIDAFCEDGFFSAAETEQILEAGAKYGLKAKIHANQLHYSGGIQVGVKHNAVSVDHLECVGDEELKCLLNSNTIGTLLPSAAFFINLPYQPARKMIDAGLAIALASDYNPGTSPSGNMLFVNSLACTQLKMSPNEAFNASTINGAYAMEIEKETGSVTVGKYADLIITKKIPNLNYMPYSFTENTIEEVFIKGI